MQKRQQKCVIQVLPALNSGGVERGTLEISEYLVKKGWRSVVISSGGKLVNRLTRNGTKHINLQTNTKNPLKWNNLRKKLKNVFEDEKPDIIHVRSRVPAWTAGKVAKKMNIPLISTIHGRHLASSLLKKYYNSASVNADKIIAISDYVKNNILKNNPEKKDIIKVIHRGADIEMFNPENIPTSRIIQISEMLQLPDEAKIIMLPARPSSWKGHEILIKSFSSINNENIICIMPGADDDGHYVTNLRNLAKKYNVLGKMVFLPFLDDLPAAYMLADVVVAPSLKPEPFGRVIIEAQAMGRPVIAFDHGGASESIKNNITGLLVEPKNEKELGNAIEKLINMTEIQRNNMANSSRKHIVNKFSLDKMNRETIKLYSEILKIK
ncbi:glycosyltransferase family 4 protein [SAR116 cluster bacterium]|nr:glycosyltransferase family 4 protein [SAR116 cluster bacterium]